jgi:hypothetical protein
MEAKMCEWAKEREELRTRLELKCKIIKLQSQVDKLDEKVKSHDSSIWALGMDSPKEISSVDWTPEALAAIQEALKQYQPKPTFTRGQIVYVNVSDSLLELPTWRAAEYQFSEDTVPGTATVHVSGESFMRCVPCERISPKNPTIAYTRGQEVEVYWCERWRKGIYIRSTGNEGAPHQAYIDYVDNIHYVTDGQIRPLQKESK